MRAYICKTLLWFWLTLLFGNVTKAQIVAPKDNSTKNQTDSAPNNTITHITMAGDTSNRAHKKERKKHRPENNVVPNDLNLQVRSDSSMPPVHDTANKKTSSLFSFFRKKKPAADMFVIRGNKLAFLNKDSLEASTLSNNNNSDSTGVTNLSAASPDTAAIFLDSARYYIKKGRYAEASAFCSSIIVRYPGTVQYPEALFLHGQAALSNDDDATALQDFNSTLDATKDKPTMASEAYLWRGLVYYKQAKIDNALHDFDNAIKTDSTNPRIHLALFYRANCYREKEQILPAIVNYTNFINADNASSRYSADALFNRAFYKMKLGDDRGSIRDYDRALDIYRNNAPTKTDMNGQKEFQEKVIQVLIQRALAKSNIEHYDEAIADYNRVLEIRSNYALAFRLRGLSKIKKGDKDAGCLDLSHAGELGNIEAYEDIKKNCK